MSLPDDYRMAQQDLLRIQKAADEFLKKSGAYGVFPTPMDALIKHADVEVVEDNVFDEGFIKRMWHKGGDLIKKAISKVQGLLDVGARLVFIDKAKLRVKQSFLTLHEIAHATLPWQCKTYQIIEDCEETLSSEKSDDFDKEANAFATEVLFQGSSFTKDAAEREFEIWTPVRLAGSKYKTSSIYAAIRRYVFCSEKACAVVVMEMPQLVEGKGAVCKLRRSVHSPLFDTIFGPIKWPEELSSGDPMGACIPVGKRKSSGKQQIYIRDKNGDNHLCIFESFTQTYQVFILIHSVKTVTSTTIIMPSAQAIKEYAG
jgi:hypothetical protein